MPSIDAIKLIPGQVCAHLEITDGQAICTKTGATQVRRGRELPMLRKDCPKNIQPYTTPDCHLRTADLPPGAEIEMKNRIAERQAEALKEI